MGRLLPRFQFLWVFVRGRFKEMSIESQWGCLRRSVVLVSERLGIISGLIKVETVGKIWNAVGSLLLSYEL